MDDIDFGKLKEILNKIDSESLEEYLNIKIKRANSDDTFLLFTTMHKISGGKAYGLLPLSDTFIKFYEANSDALGDKKERFSKRIKDNSEKIRCKKEEIRNLIDKNDELIGSQEELEKLIQDLTLKETQYNHRVECFEASKKDKTKIEDNVKKLENIVKSKRIEELKPIPDELLGEVSEGIMRNYKEILGACYINSKVLSGKLCNESSEQNDKKILYEFILLKTFLEENGSCIVNDADVEDVEEEYKKIMSEIESTSNNAKEFFSKFIDRNNE